MLDQSTFILVAVGSAFVVVGILAWLVDSGLNDSVKVYVKYGLFGLFACIIGLFFMIEDDSEFQYGGWTPSSAAKGTSRGGGGGMGQGSGGGGKAEMKDGGGGGGGELAMQEGSGSEDTDAVLGEETEVTDEESDGSKLDCPVCPEVVQIKKGKALIGSSRAENAKKGQLAPAAEVAISRDFGIGKYEVTFEQYSAFTAETGYKAASSCKAGKKSVSFEKPGFKQTLANPAVCVSFEDATAYTEWLTFKTGISYRLPTEIEWEYAARAGVTGPYSTAGPITGELANFNVKDSLKKKNGTMPVGSYAANGNNMHDVHGNVWELTADCWSLGYLGRSGEGQAGQIDCTRRVAKGGAWYSGAGHLNFSARVGVGDKFANNGLGFRVIRENDAPVGRKKKRLSNGFGDGLPENFKTESAPKQISFDPVSKQMVRH